MWSDPEYQAAKALMQEQLQQLALADLPQSATLENADCCLSR